MTTTLRAFTAHIFIAFVVLLAFCLVLARIAAALAYILQHHQAFAVSVLASAAVTRNRFAVWWRAAVRQQAVGAKSRHQLRQGKPNE